MKGERVTEDRIEWGVLDRREKRLRGRWMGETKSERGAERFIVRE